MTTTVFKSSGSYSGPTASAPSTGKLGFGPAPAVKKASGLVVVKPVIYIASAK